MDIPKIFLKIDGNFFAHRTLHGMRVINKNITLDSDEEMKNFNKSLIMSFHSIFNHFANINYRIIDQIIMVFDHSSWRKHIEQFKPYYVDELSTKLNKQIPFGYKDNRKELKEESDINYDNFDYCVDEFRQHIQKLDIIPLFWNKGSEGDDNLIMLKERLLEENPDNKMIVFCTDGDLKQLLYIGENAKSDSVVLYRNISSALAPQGEFVVSKDMFLDLTKEKDMFEIFLEDKNSFTNICKNTLFKINLKDQSLRANYERKFNADIVSGTPYLTLLIKIIIGDKKDNVLPILRWANKKNSGFYSVSEKQIIKAFEECGMTFNEETALSIFKDKKVLSMLIYSLISITKQDWILEDGNRHIINEIGKHFSHNRKILTITTSEYIPTNVVSGFNMQFEEQRHKFDIRLTKEMLGEKLKQDFSSNGILASSLPDIDTINIPDDLKNI